MRFRVAVPLLLVFSLGAWSAPKFPGPAAQNRRLGRGVNLPGVFDRSGGEVPDPPLKAGYFARIRQAGFQSVRLPVRWSSHAAEDAPFTIDPGFLEKVDWAVDQCIRNGLAVVLDFHYYPLISFTGTAVSHEDPAKNRARFLALWTQIAGHYQASPPEVMFGLLNEPSRTNLGIDGWNRLIGESLPVLRRGNPGRTILIATANGGGFGTISDLRIPAAERNAIVEVHYYSPGKFTHQQAPWSSNRIYKDITWTATAEEAGAVREDFAGVAAWAKRNRRPLYLGEFGAYRAADMPSRVRWTDFVARTAEKNGMSWAYWGFWRCGFDIFDGQTESWTEPLLHALVPR